MPVLIVDGSIQITDRLVNILSDAETITDIHTAVSYEEANNLFKENEYDTVLLDIGFPGNESFKLLKEIKKKNKKIRVIVLFTHINDYIHEQWKSTGADFFVDKYYDFEIICKVIDSIEQITASQKSYNQPPPK